MIWEAIPIIGGIVQKGLDVIDKLVPDKDLAEKLKHEYQTTMMNQDFSLLQKQIDAQVQVIVAEAGGESWLQRNWRPALMAIFGLIVANNYIVAPYLGAMFRFSVMLELPPDMWDLLKIGVGGYVVGRSVEKGLDAWSWNKYGKGKSAMGGE